MRKLTLVLMTLVLSTGFAFAGPVDIDEGLRIHQHVFDQPLTSAGKADTTLIGFWDFSNPLNPAQGDWQDWTSHDYTYLTPKWHIDTFNAENLGIPAHGAGNKAYYAGETFEYDCGGTFEGYANGYNEFLDWWGTIDDTEAGAVITVNAYVNVDTEADWDYLYLQYEDGTGSMEKFILDATTREGMTGLHENVYKSVSVNLPSGEYVNGDQVHLRWLAHSDTYVSDFDCVVYGYHGNGHTQIDDVQVFFNQGLPEQQGLTNTFEDGSQVDWDIVQVPYVGDFADVWDSLGDIDPCVDNVTPQMAFIDYGQNPGVGPSSSIVWNYGPGGYVTNYTYGYAGTIDYRLDNAIWSPPMTIDPNTAGHEIRFDVYRHFDLSTMAGQFYTWNVRATTDGFIWSPWQNRAFVYYGGPDYGRRHNDVTDLVTPGAISCQISLEVTTPWTAYIYGPSTPAPYFDNVSWHAYDFEGPAYAYREFELAQDNFPHDAGGLPTGMNWGDLGGMDVPFNMGQDIIGTDGAGIQHGDSIIMNIDAVRAGSGLDARPRMYYEVKTNPVFDTDPAWRSSGVLYSGYVLGDTIWVSETQYAGGRWAFTLPDYDFLYPGDVMHYYFSASDTVGASAPVFATLPEDLAGFGVFEGEAGFVPWQWPSDFTVHALPTVRSTTVGDVPDILLWNDFGDRGAENEWEGSLKALGLERGEEYDLYYTNGPSSGTGNGLGSTCTVATLALYDHMLYSSGDLGAVTMTGTKVPGVEDPFDGDGSNDIGLVKSYLLGGGNLFALGDSFINSIFNEPDGSGVSMVNNFFGVNYGGDDIRLTIDGQSAPTVAPVAVLAGQLDIVDNFVAYGSCPNFRDFDLIRAAGPTAYAVGEFLDPDGNPGAYYTGSPGSYTGLHAMVANELPTGSRVVVAPVGLDAWFTPYSKVDAPFAVRVDILCRVLSYFYDDLEVFDCEDRPPGTDVGIQQRFYAKNWPNPFNPITKIEFSPPRDGHVSLKIFNVRGELVRTLVDGNRLAGRQVVEWDGSDDRGQSVASGVYFYETRTAGKSIVNKMALVK